VKEQLETRLRSLITECPVPGNWARNIQLAVTVDPAVISAMPLPAASPRHPGQAAQAGPEHDMAAGRRMAGLDPGRRLADHDATTAPLGPVSRHRRQDDARA